MYESIVHGSQIYQSVAPAIIKTETLTKASGNIDWETSLNAGQALIIKKMYQHGQTYD